MKKFLLIAIFPNLLFSAFAQDTDDFLNDFVLIKTPGKEFYISKFAVTVKEWNEFLEITGSTFDYTIEQWEQSNLPALVTKMQAESYLAFITDWYQIPFRLPTEIEWQQAALGTIINKRYDKPLCVSCMPPNSKGLYGMLGNVWEWTSTIGATDENDSAYHYYIIKGGDYQEPMEELTVSMHSVVNPEMNMMNTGFRLVADAAAFEKALDIEEANTIMKKLFPNPDLEYYVVTDGIRLNDTFLDFGDEENNIPVVVIDEDKGAFYLCCHTHIASWYSEEEMPPPTAEGRGVSFSFTKDKLPLLKRLKVLVEKIQIQ